MNRHSIHGSALALPLPDDSVDLVVTSPPYFGLRSYTDGGESYDGQVGSEPTPAEFIDALLAATREMIRVVKPSGSIWINLGDKYNAYNGSRGDGAIQTNGPRQIVPKGNGLDVKGIRAKSLLGLPWRYAIRCIDTTQGIPPQIVREMIWQVYAGELHPDACEAIIAEYETGGRNAGLGLILRETVIWAKPNGMPESVTDRARRSHEDWFHFTLKPRYYSAVEEIGKLPGSVWTIPTEPLDVPGWHADDHYAAFPTEWPKRIIQGWSPAHGVVLDPFGGTGTTAHVADALGRHGISVDLSAGYSGIAADDWMRRQRLAKVKGLAKPPKGAAPDLHPSGTGSLFEVTGQ